MITTDCIFLHQLRLMARLGILAHEKEAPQPILLDIELAVDVSIAGKTTNLADTVDYARLAQDISVLCLEEHVDLVETLVEKIAAYCLSDQRVQQVVVQLSKPRALAECAQVGVRIVRRS